MGKKIGILTFHRSHNYGSALQSFALQKYINNHLHIETELIDFIPPNYEKLYSIFVKNDSIRSLVRNIVALISYRMKKNRNNSFIQFQKYIPKSNESFKDIKECTKYIEDNYDMVICGSDQIWCNLAPDFSMMYFVPESKCPKMSYAASIGNGILKSCEYIDNIKTELTEFEKVLVREQNGKEQIDELFEKNISQVVLDPTFLLNANEYEEITSTNNQINGKYIFFYSVGFNSQIAKIVSTISRKSGLPVYTFPTNTASFKYKKYGIKFVKNLSPSDFLWYIKNADCVLSSSFHGTAFSIINRKKFYCLGNVNESGELIVDNRLVNILKTFNISVPIVTVKNVNEIDINDELIYDENLITGLIDESKAALNEGIIDCLSDLYGG